MELLHAPKAVYTREHIIACDIVEYLEYDEELTLTDKLRLRRNKIERKIALKTEIPIKIYVYFRGD